MRSLRCLRRTLSAATLGAVCAPGLVAVSVAAAGGDAAKRPNVLLIVCDDLNDSVEGFGGHPQAITPNLDAFAETATRFQRAYTNNPVCAPSRSSFLTGLYNHTSGNLFWDPWHKNEIQRNSHTLMSYFRENGYHTAGTGKLMHHFRRGEWVEFGNEADYGPVAWNGEKRVGHPSVPAPFRDIGPIDGSFGRLSDVPFGGVDGAGWSVGPWNDTRPMRYVSENDRDPTPDEANAAWAAAFIEGYDERGLDQPFFLGVGFIRPHTPMFAPDRFFEMFPLDTVELAESIPGDMADSPYRDFFGDDQKGLRYYRDLESSYPTVEDGLRAYTQAYLACVAAVDENIGQVLDALDASPHANDTIVVITSDHGFHLGEKQYVFKGSPWEESARVPMLVRVPGMTPGGSEVLHPVSLIDLYPTLADLCGLEGDTWKTRHGRPLDGHSMRPFLENPGTKTWEGPAGALTMVYAGHAFAGEPLRQHMSYRTSRWRYIRYNDGREELYDHETDPNEWTNLAGDAAHAGVIARLSAEVDGLMATAGGRAAREAVAVSRGGGRD